MLLAFFNFADRIVWRLSDGDPALFPLPGTGGEWSLVNPLLYPKLPVPSNELNSILHVGPGKYFWVNSEIVFAAAENRSDKPVIQKFEDLIPVISELLARLRHVSGQATLPRGDSFVAGGNIEILELPSLVAEKSPPAPPFYVQKYLWVSAVTAERIGAAAAIGPKFIPHTHEVLFLDAIAAHRSNDHRRAILYAAISAEVALGNVIDEAYNQMLAAQNDERFRAIELPQAAGTTVRKDPVYEKLRNRADFNVLLHELSLYVLRRSLLADDQRLYAEAKSLYSTRNQVVHSGGLAEGDSNPPYPLDARGAMAALKTAVGLFSWLGIRDDFPLPDGGFVSYPSQASW
jgi:hypothetical protein